ncbi:MAG: dipeptide ABC transporter ATP-binding protein [Gammaproteobacteria bacterium]|nr:dipeptide ABC transporter ATP-binding protein [Gammaproteobacteria bacterium]
MSLLRVNNLCTDIKLSDRTINAVKDISFEVNNGETFALVGESGSGKSITALSIARLLPDAAKISQGQVLLNGDNLLDHSEREMRSVRGSKISMIFQEPMTSLNPVIKIGDQIIESMIHHESISKSVARGRCLDLLNAVGLPNAQRNMKEYPHQLSGGMRQRIMIAIALAASPDVLIADEPTTALDVTIQAQVLELLKKLQEELKMGLIFITHDLGVVQQIADRVAVMRYGEIVETASSEAFFLSPKHAYSQQLLNAVPSIHKRGTRLSVNGEQAIDSISPSVQPDEHDHPVLDVHQLKVHFPIRKGIFKRVVGYVKAVNDVSLKLYPGKTLALVGESGCGKTTVGKSILRLLEVTNGDVNFQGQNLISLDGEALRARRSELQIVFQDPYSSLNPRMLVGDIIEEGMVSLGIENNASQRRLTVAKLLGQVGLPEDASNRYPHEFSGGQRQRICIARALAVKPQVIICDEPTSALDVSVQAQVLNLLKDLQAKLGMSYLFITHDMSVVSYLADDVAVMHGGEIVESGTALDVLQNPQHDYTKKLLSAVPKLHLH